MSGGRLSALVVWVALFMVPGILWAHTGESWDISLDEDPELKAAVLRAGTKYLRKATGKTGSPGALDMIQGKVAVNFDRDRSLVVLLNVNEFGTTGHVWVHGFRNLRLRPPSPTAGLSETEARRAAEATFSEIPEKFRNELKFQGHELVAGVFNFHWRREIKGLPVLGNEDLNVGVDRFSGQLVYWDLGLFDFPPSLIETRPQLSAEEATKLASAALKTIAPVPMHLVEGSPPQLVIFGRAPMWAIRASSKIPATIYETYYILVNALTGETVPAGQRLR